MIPKLSAFSGREIYYNQGLSAFASRLLIYPYSFLFTLIVSTLIVVYTYWIIGVEKTSFIVSVIVFLPVFLMIEPLSWQHHYVFLLPTFVWVWITGQKTIQFIALFLASYMLVSINIVSPQHAFGPFILSHVLWGNILLYILAVREVRILGRKKSYA